MAHAMIVGAVRTAVGKKGGALAGVRPDDLLADTLKALVERVKIDASEVEDVVIGCVDQVGEQGFNIARNAALIAGFPLDVCGTTLDRMCGSGQQAQASTPGQSMGGMMCGAASQAQDDPMADKPAQPQQRSGGMCPCCRNMAMMRGGGMMQHQGMPGMEQPKE